MGAAARRGRASFINRRARHGTLGLLASKGDARCKHVAFFSDTPIVDRCHHVAHDITDHRGDVPLFVVGPLFSKLRFSQAALTGLSTWRRDAIGTLIDVPCLCKRGSAWFFFQVIHFSVGLKLNGSKHELVPYGGGCAKIS